MGRVMLGYMVFMLMFFLMLTVMASVEVALWTFGAVHVACALGVCVCAWWELEAFQLTRLERRELATYRGCGAVTEWNDEKDALLHGDVAGLRR